MTISWNQPVELHFADSGTVAVTGPQEALDYLLMIWPSEEGDVYRTCRDACMEAIEGVVPVEEARRIFQSAASKAGVVS